MSRGQTDIVPIPFVLGFCFCLWLWVGTMIIDRMQARVTSDTTLCASGCEFWWPPSEVAGVLAAGVIVLIVLVGIFGRAFMFARFSSRSDDADG